MIELVDGMTKNRYNMGYMDVFNEINHMMGHEPGIQEIYYTKQDRLYAANPMSLIMFHGEPAGFINLVQEDIDNIKFLDAGIIEKYRGLGICKGAIKRLYLDSYKEYIIGETMKNNMAANCVGKNLGDLVYRSRNKMYYLFQPNLTYKFLNSEEFSELVDRDPNPFVKRLHR